MSLESVPAALRARRQWVLWKIEVRDGKPTKVPYNPRTRGKARSNTPGTWGSFAEAMAAWGAHRGQFDGVGYMFAEDDPYVGVDLDNCIAEDGTLKSWARPIVGIFDSYGERSPSGCGLHIFIEGTLPEESRHKVPCGDGHIEAYDRLRFFTMTGDAWAEDREIEGRQVEIGDLVRYWLGTKEPNASSETQRPAQPVDLDDRDLVAKMLDARGAYGIDALWRGDADAYGGDESRADLALCNHLAFWTDRDAARMDQLFRQSGLYREKWDSSRPGGTYGTMTIAKALAGTTEGYRGSRAPEWQAPSDEDAPPERGTDWVALHEPTRREHEARRKLEERVPRNGKRPPIEIPATATVEELMARVLPPVQWVVPDMIAPGFTCLFGKSKMRKSWLTVALALAVSQGGVVLGSIPVAKRGVLYLGMEDTERRLQDRLRKMLGSDAPPANLHYRTSWPRFGAKHNGDLMVREWLRQHPDVGLAIFDTFAKARNMQQTGGSAYDQDYDAASMFKDIADDFGIAVLGIHHQSKASRDDWVDTLNASSGLAAASDTLLLLDGKRGESSATLRMTGRDVETQDIHLEWNKQAWIWTAEGSAEEFDREREREAVWAVLDRLQGTAKVASIADGLATSRNSAYQLVNRLVQRGDLQHLGSGFYARPSTH